MGRKLKVSLQWIVYFVVSIYDEFIEGGILMDKKRTGELIKNARMRKNYTQTELGDLVGVSNKAVSRWENGVSQS